MNQVRGDDHLSPKTGSCYVKERIKAEKMVHAYITLQCAIPLENQVMMTRWNALLTDILKVFRLHLALISDTWEIIQSVLDMTINAGKMAPLKECFNGNCCQGWVQISG